MTANTIKVPRSLVADETRFGGRAERDCLVGKPVVRDGRLVGLAQTDVPDETTGIVTMRLTEAHCHLDKCHTAERIAPHDGTLPGAIAAQAADKINWTAQDIRERVARGLQELVDAGCGFVRTHVDCQLDASDPERMPLAWDVIGELGQDWRDRIVVQRAALLPLEAFADGALGARVARRIASDGGVLGAFVYDQPGRHDLIPRMVKAAASAGIGLDFHVDEGLSSGLDGLDIIAASVLDHRFDGPVLCGHACSLMNASGDALSRRIDRIAEAGLAIVTLPASNLYLQSRGTGTPDRRGITRVKELLSAGVPVAIGSDNVRDAFTPVGRHDPLAALSLGLLAAHLDPPLGQWLPCVTRHARYGIDGTQPFIEGTTIGDLLLWDARSTAGLLSGARPRPLALAA
ncbi:amidohydrolase family protein [Mesorhizobium sp. CAU 1732]|uniref:amidohydrolase family protein n=1 Tax=Mesorhizobium sp. CAU 1732 TaxID=3140358 RepID=UPI0032619C8B